MAHKRRDCCEIVREGEAPKGGEKGASGDGAKRRAAMRLGKASGRAAGDGSGATEQRQREDRVFLRLHRQAKRAASGSARDRHPKGEDREAGFVEPGGAKPRPAE